MKQGRIYDIIVFSRVKNSNKKGECIVILNKRIKYYTKEVLKIFNIIIIAFGFIIAIVLLKYKPMYKVIISGEELGYVEDIKALEENVKQKVLEEETKNVESIEIKNEPEYELKFVSKKEETNEEYVEEKLKENLDITYKYYEIALKDDVIDSVNTCGEAEQLVNQIKEENSENEIDLSISEKYSNNKEEVKTTEVEVAKENILAKVNEEIKEQEEAEEERKRIESMPVINGVRLAVLPINGTISSRYGVSSRIRSSTHTGLDIAAASGTPIKVVSDGIVTCASYNGAYGNLVKVDHGNGIETWYAHTSKMYVTIGQQVKAGDVIAAVGSTGNSTGAHLHLEIRINGQHVNPQDYLYK